jgi:hypothetical protein
LAPCTKQATRGAGDVSWSTGKYQILFPAWIDLEDAYDTYPSQFSGLKVSYVREDSGPRPTYDSVASSQNTNALRLGSFGIAIQDAPKAKSIKSKLGVKVQDEDENLFITISTHLITKTLLANMADYKGHVRTVKIWSGTGALIRSIVAVNISLLTTL